MAVSEMRWYYPIHHSRSFVVERLEGSFCDRCGEEDVNVLELDGSDGEYGCITLCESCLVFLVGGET